MKSGVVDYRMGNLASVSKALESVGVTAVVSSDEAQLGACDVLVVPGVGNFAAGMRKLEELKLTGFLKSWSRAGRPLVGICLGMQLLFEHSEEGDTEGLGLLPGKVVALPPSVKVPHMGWNTVSVRNESLSSFDGKRFYFVHSYVCDPESEVVAATTSYGREFTALVHSGSIVGMQFHPEKSSSDGLDLLSVVLNLIR